MMRRPQRTEAACGLEARTARTFAAPLRAGVSLNSGPARSQAESASAGARARGVPRPLSSQPPHGESATQRHAACGEAMHAACARPQLRPAAALVVAPGGPSHRLPEASRAARRKCWPQPLAAAELTLQRPAMLARTLPGHAAAILRHLHRAHAACIATPHAPCHCVALSLCCVCENNGGGTPRARASAQGGFRLAARGATG